MVVLVQCPVVVMVVLVQSISSMVVQRDGGIQVLYKLVVRGWLSKNANNAYYAYALRVEDAYK